MANVYEIKASSVIDAAAQKLKDKVEKTIIYDFVKSSAGREACAGESGLLGISDAHRYSARSTSMDRWACPGSGRGMATRRSTS